LPNAKTDAVAMDGVVPLICVFAIAIGNQMTAVKVNPLTKQQ
jgi:hypothetical protein